MAHTATRVVKADWLFTTPTVILQPLSGGLLMHMAGFPWSGWVQWSVGLFVFAGLCWFPVVWLQIRMRDLAVGAHQTGEALDPRYFTYARYWLWLGVPAFPSIVVVFWLMVAKPV
jgi:uncharacterized membrane protein